MTGSAVHPTTLPGADVPAYRTVPFFGNLTNFQNRPIELFNAGLARCGDVVAFPVGPERPVLVNEPDAVHRVLTGNAKNYAKTTRGYQKLRLVVGNGLLTSNGSFWLRQRRIAQPAFHRQRIAGFARTMNALTADMIKDLAQKSASGVARVDFGQEMMRLTMRIVGMTLLGIDVGGRADEVSDALTVALERVDKLVVSPIPFAERWPTPSNRRFNRAVEVLDDVVWSVIDARRKSGEVGEDLLGMLMEARDEDTGEGMSDEQLRDEVMTMFLAGHETTANALTWTTYLLGQNPEALGRATAEARALTADDIGMAELGALPYVGACVDEALRLYPPAWIIARHPVEDDVLGGFRIKKGTWVLICPYTLHRHPAYWSQPEAFRPERFLDKNKPVAGSYIPFIEGPRMCIGKAFAKMEASIILGQLLRHFDVALPAGLSVGVDPALTLRPRGTVSVELRTAG